MKQLKNIESYFIKSFLAGIMISIGGTIFLSLDNKVLGSLFFSIGLFIICVRGFNLFTGKIGYIFENKVNYLIEVLITLIGNFTGTFFSAFILRYTRIYNNISLKSISLCNIKLSDTKLSIFILSIFCGLLMYLAVDNYKNGKDILSKYISVILCVIVFILCGFEHSIANMFYFSIASMWNAKAFIYLFIMILGNSVGGNIIPLLNKILYKCK